MLAKIWDHLTMFLPPMSLEVLIGLVHKGPDASLPARLIGAIIGCV
jgi:hypothetical protein